MGRYVFVWTLRGEVGAGRTGSWNRFQNGDLLPHPQPSPFVRRLSGDGLPFPYAELEEDEAERLVEQLEDQFASTLINRNAPRILRRRAEARAPTVQSLLAQGFTYAEIGRQVGVTRERIRQLANKYGIQGRASHAARRARREYMQQRRAKAPRHEAGTISERPNI
jgi:hypothetical protein